MRHSAEARVFALSVSSHCLESVRQCASTIADVDSISIQKEQVVGADSICEMSR